MDDLYRMLELAQRKLEKVIEAHGGTFDDELGAHRFPTPALAGEFGLLVEAAQLISEIQEVMETRSHEHSHQRRAW